MSVPEINPYMCSQPVQPAYPDTVLAPAAYPETLLEPAAYPENLLVPGGELELAAPQAPSAAGSARGSTAQSVYNLQKALIEHNKAAATVVQALTDHGGATVSQAEYYKSKPPNMFDKTMVELVKRDIKSFSNTRPMQVMRREADAINGVAGRGKKGKARHQTVERYSPTELLQMVRTFENSYPGFGRMLDYVEDTSTSTLVHRAKDDHIGVDCVSGLMWNAFLNALTYVKVEEDAAHLKRSEQKQLPFILPLSQDRQHMLQKHATGEHGYEASDAGSSSI